MAARSRRAGGPAGSHAAYALVVRPPRSWLIIVKRALLVPVFILAACQSTKWSEAPPEVVRGTWVQVSDDVSARLDIADSLVIDATHVYLARYRLGTEPTRLSCPIRRVSEHGGSYVVFCGAPNAHHIAEHRLKLDPESSGRFLLAGELVATGVNDTDGYESIGRFVYFP